MKNSPVHPLFTMSGPEPRRKRVIMKLFMVMLVLLAIFAAFELSSISDRKARRMMAKADQDASAGLVTDAIDIYERIATTNKVDNQIRIDANRRLIELYRGPLKDPAAAQIAQMRIDTLGPSKPGSTDIDTTPATQATPAPEYQIVARVGGQDVTLEQILYAWSQFNGNRAPDKDEFEPFVKQYLNMVLMADEAQRLGLDKRGQLALDMQLNRLISLNKAMTIQLVKQLPTPSEKELIEFAQKTWGGEGDPAVNLGVIVMDTRSQAAAVMDKLNAGEEMGKLTADSNAAKQLADGYKVDNLDFNAPEVPGLGKKAGLAARLAAYADGVTTGPIRVEDGWAAVKILSHKPGRITSIKGHEEQVMAAYQRIRLAEIQQKELDRLRHQTNIEIFKDGAPAPQTDPAESPAAGDGVTTVTAHE